VAFSDGHAETITDRALFVYSQIALPTYGGSDKWTNYAWDYLDGDTPRMRQSYFLPPEFLE